MGGCWGGDDDALYSLVRVSRKVKSLTKKYLTKKKKNGAAVDPSTYSPITAIDSTLLPEDAMPLLVFVNSRSGGQLGGYLLRQLRQNLNPLQVVDLDRTGPKPALKLFLTVPNVRILVCGGDGTVAWILQALEDFPEVNPPPPVGIIPLGTGNDLARVLGWGGGFNNDLMSELLTQIQEAHPAVLDRWEVRITPNLSAPPSPKRAGSVPDNANGGGGGGRGGAVAGPSSGNGGGGPGDPSVKKQQKEIIYQNYLGIGVDAQAALRFHRTR